MIATALGLEAAFAARAGDAVGCDPVAEHRILAHERALFDFLFEPVTAQFTVDHKLMARH